MGRGAEGITPAKEGVRDRLIHSIYGLVHDDEEWPALLGIMDELFSESDDSTTEASRPDHATSLLPHIERANLLLEKISELHIKSTLSDRVIDRIPMGIVLITPETKIVSKNFRADAVLNHIQANYRDGKLAFRDMKHQRAFLKAIEEVASGKAQASPIRMGELNVWVSHYGEGYSAQLVVYFGHQTFQRNIRTDQLTSLFGLTEKEARLTAELCNGHASLEEAAEHLGIGLSTGRTHLKHIFAKTGTRRQADLVKMVLVNPILTLQQRSSPQAGKSPNRLNDTLIARLPSGRTLSYAEYGDPKGKAVLFCHAITGCRLMVPADKARLARMKIRLIAPDRAGYGFSSPANENCMQQWLEDMRHFLPMMNVSSCCAIGHSAGGAHAMALAAAFPALVERLCLISSVAPLRNVTDTRHMLPINRMVIHLARSNPEAARSFLRLSLQVAKKKSDSYFSLITNSLPDLDKEVLGNTELQQHLLGAFAETTRQGIDHLIDEIMYISTSWRINARQINCPVNIWHGTDDMHAPFTLMEKFSQRLQQDVATNWMDGAGHYMLFKHWPEIVSGLHSGNKPGGRLMPQLLGLAFSPQLAEWLELFSTC